jgi:hypothetical protein
MNGFGNQGFCNFASTFDEAIARDDVDRRYFAAACPD